MIAIVDYGLGNLASVRNAFLATGADVRVTSDAGDIGNAAGIVLPGVGAAAAGMEGLRTRGLDSVVLHVARAGIPFLGHCLGMQLLFDTSEENGGTPCLGLLPGRVRRLHGSMKIPHIGWNQVATKNLPIWSDLSHDPYFYFVHSYVCEPTDSSVIAGTTCYGDPFCSAVVSGTIWGAQFHPERSGTAGLGLIRNFVQACKR